VLETSYQALIELPGYLLDANKRIFWGYLLSGLVLAILVLKLSQRHRPWREVIHLIFDKRIWWSSTARQDYALFFANKVIKGVTFGPILLTMVPVALGVTDGLVWLFGPAEPWVVNQYLVIGLFTLALFVVDDFSRFLLHYMLHRIPVLWDFHKVHHSAHTLTPMTIYRSHPVESYLYACRMALSQGSVVGGAYYIFGTQLAMADIVGANLFVFLFNIFGSNLRHSHVWLSWGSRWESWFISPAQHQIHHSRLPQHFDRNLGSALAIWDRMAGTLIYAKGVKLKGFGVGAGDPGHPNLWAIYLWPFKQAILRMVIFRKRSFAPR
jgi:sterol desaturase/sphingolipid hydroxylase (fatty acid hydroxylase superfamily)